MFFSFSEQERDRFSLARAAAVKLLGAGGTRRGIGVYGEKTLHATLKYYYQPDSTRHEVGMASLVADACIEGEDGVQTAVEIQTGSFVPLAKKLEKYRDAGTSVLVVMPLVAHKRIVWADRESGELHKPRRSPRVGRVSDALKELYFIREYLLMPNLTVDVLLIDMDEYRVLDGWGNGGKRGSHRIERFPSEALSLLRLTSLQDYMSFVPTELENGFTAREYAKLTHLTPRRANSALRLLVSLGLLAREKEGRGYLYRRLE